MSVECMPVKRDRLEFVDKLQFYTVTISLVACGYIALNYGDLSKIFCVDQLKCMFFFFGIAALFGIISLISDSWRIYFEGDEAENRKKAIRCSTRLVRYFSAVADIAVALAILLGLIFGVFA